MREAMENMDGCGGPDDFIRQASNMYLGDDYKEVKAHIPVCVCLINPF